MGKIILLFKANPSALDPVSVCHLQELYSISYPLFPRSLQSAIPLPPHFEACSAFVPAADALFPSAVPLIQLVTKAC